MKKLFIMIMVLMFTTMLFSLNQPKTTAINFEIETTTGDQDGKMVVLPEVATGIAELEFSNVAIVENVAELRMKQTERMDAITTTTGWEKNYEITGIAGGSVLKMPSLTLVVNINCEGYLSAGALKIPNYIISKSVNVKENCEETGCINS